MKLRTKAEIASIVGLVLTGLIMAQLMPGMENGILAGLCLGFIYSVLIGQIYDRTDE